MNIPSYGLTARTLSRIRSAAVVMLCTASIVGCSSSSKVERSAGPSPTAATRGDASPELKSYQQKIDFSVKNLTLKTGQRVTIPVVVTNSSSDVWLHDGKNPVDLSYHWIRKEEHLPIEGERTPLPHALPPGQSVTLNATVVAPNSKGAFVLGFSMVQEGVVWFSNAPAGSWYRIPV